MGSPKVSVGLQFFNNERTLRRAIQSILNQSYQNWELILHDDGATDTSLEIASSFASDARVRIYADGVNRKRPRRLNEWIDLAQGKYLAVMDGDDIAYPHRIERQVEYLEQHPQVDLVGSWMIVFRGDGEIVGKREMPTAHAAICASPWAGFPIAQPTFMGRVDWFRRFRYDETNWRSQDQDLLVRAYRTSQFANVPEILLGYREESVNIKKILFSRRFFAKSFFREFRKQGRLDWAIRVVIEQIAKGARDCVAVGSGLQYRLLPHRARPVTEQEIRAWKTVMQSMSA